MRDPRGRHRRPGLAWWRRLAVGGALAASGAGCSEDHVVPQQPTWTDVEPIVRGSCTQCHGANAARAGAAYRFDFFDVSPDVCGEAAIVLDGQPLAHGLATLMGTDVTPPGSGWRARMPPAPGTALTEWQRTAVQRWAKNPTRGLPPSGDHRPEIQISSGSAVGDKSLSLSVVVSDADGESVVGVLKIGDQQLLMDRSGAFTGTVDTSTWPNGIYPVAAVLCDGWDNVTYQLGNAQIRHAEGVTPAMPEGGAPDAGVADAGGSDGSSSDGAPSDKPLAQTDAPAAHD